MLSSFVKKSQSGCAWIHPCGRPELSRGPTEDQKSLHVVHSRELTLGGR